MLVELPFTNSIKGEKFQYLSSFTHLQVGKINLSNFHIISQIPPLELILLLQKQQLLNLTFEIGVMDLPLDQNKKDLIKNLEQYFKVHPNLQLFSSFAVVEAKQKQEQSASKPLIHITHNLPIVQHLSNECPPASHSNVNITFPPLPPSETLNHTIISDYCNESRPENYTESGCAVCASLTPIKNSTPIRDVQDKLQFLNEYGNEFTRTERKSTDDPIRPLDGPMIDEDCHIVCSLCMQDIKRKQLPKYAIANGLWLGKVPPELSDLTESEKILIAKLRCNKFVFKLASGMSKIKTQFNCIPSTYS